MYYEVVVWSGLNLQLEESRNEVRIMAAVLRVLDPVTPTEAESQLAETSSRALSGYVRDEEGQTITVLPEGAEREQAVAFLLWLSACSSTF